MASTSSNASSLWSPKVLNGLKTQYVEPGACLASLKSGQSVLTSCALEPRFCPTTYGISGKDSESFLSSHQLHQLGSSSPGYSCLASDGLDARHYVHVGRCASKVDEYICTSVAENCKNVAEFEESSELCTLLADLSPDRKAADRTLFSSCYKTTATTTNDSEFRCFWSGTDCSATGFEDFGARPYSYFLECECEDTEVGACKSNINSGEYCCAVSEQSCDSETTFIGVHDLRLNHGIDCRLCQTPKAIPDAITTATPVRPSQTSSGPKGLPNGQTNNNDKTSSGDNQKLLVGAIVGAVVGGLALAVLILWMVRRIAAFRYKKKGGTAIVLELAEETASKKTSQDIASNSESSSVSGSNNNLDMRSQSGADGADCECL